MKIIMNIFAAQSTMRRWFLIAMLLQNIYCEMGSCDVLSFLIQIYQKKKKTNREENKG